MARTSNCWAQVSQYVQAWVVASFTFPRTSGRGSDTVASLFQLLFRHPKRGRIGQNFVRSKVELISIVLRDAFLLTKSMPDCDIPTQGIHRT